ncbi:hypothetical protein Mrose_03550 [Calidithermus roseus]|uniref:Uncharacterized protein n=1 Tax=Calidithermus roseus TaxID=1644118 RepID=A0A399ECM4_9DEIN|nr:hypothetical protein Mrose_03550 [Calidithermus roseus]
MVGQHHVAPCHADAPEWLPLEHAAEAQCEGQGVGYGPLHLQQRQGLGGVGGVGHQRVLARRDPAQPHHVALLAVGVGLEPALGPLHLLEEQVVARLQPQLCAGVLQGGLGGPFGQAAVFVAPGVQLDAVVGLKEGQVVQGLEGLRHLAQGFGEPVGREHGAAGLEPRQQQAAGAVGAGVGAGQDQAVGGGGDLEADPGPRVAAVVHGVVQQPGVPPQRDALPRGAQVGFGGHGVLVVAQVVAHVGQQLHQCHLQVGGRALLPAGHEQGQPIEHQAAEAGVVLGQVIQPGLAQRLGRTLLLGGAVEVAGALDLEGKLHLGELGVEAGGRSGDGGALHQPQGVAGVVALLLGADHQHLLGVGQTREVAALLERHQAVGHLGGVGGVGGELRGHVSPAHPHPPDAHAPLEAHVALAQGRVDGLEAAQEQGALPLGGAGSLLVEHLEVVDAVVVHAVEARLGQSQGAGGVLAAVLGHDRLTGCAGSAPPAAPGCAAPRTAR